MLIKTVLIQIIHIKGREIIAQFFPLHLQRRSKEGSLSCQWKDPLPIFFKVLIFSLSESSSYYQGFRLQTSSNLKAPFHYGTYPQRCRYQLLTLLFVLTHPLHLENCVSLYSAEECIIFLSLPFLEMVYFTEIRNFVKYEQHFSQKKTPGVSVYFYGQKSKMRHTYEQKQQQSYIFDPLPIQAAPFCMGLSDPSFI